MSSTLQDANIVPTSGNMETSEEPQSKTLVKVGQPSPNGMPDADTVSPSLMATLPEELQTVIKMKVVENLHNGIWSAWRYDRESRKLTVELGKLYVAWDMGEQMEVIRLLVDLSIVDILELRRCFIVHWCPFFLVDPAVEFVEQIDMEIFKPMVDAIDLDKVVRFIVDDQSTEYLDD